MSLILAVNMFAVFTSADTARDFTEATESAEKLKALGLFKGVSDTDFALERAPSRVEALVMLIRILGKEADALKAGKTHPFTDVPQWADAYVSYAYTNGLTNGISATLFGTSDASAATYLTFVLRALGYSDTNGKDFTWDKPFDLAKSTGILTEGVDTDNFLRADVAIVSKNALTAKISGTETTLAQKLIADGAIGKAAYDKVFPTEIKPEDTTPSVDLSKFPAPVKIDFANEDYFQINTQLYEHPGNPTEGGVYEFTDGGLKLLYNQPGGDWQGQYRVMFRFEVQNFITDQHKYMQVVYRTDAKSGELRFHNNGTLNEWVVLAADVSASAGEFVKSELVTISPAMIKRLNNCSPMTVGLHTNKTDIDFVIKEINLYCDPAQVDANTNEESKEVGQAFPAIYKLGAENLMRQSGVKFYDHGESKPTEEGVFEFATVDDQKALKLMHDPHTWAGNYRVMFRPISNDRAKIFENSDTWYVRVKYKTDAHMQAMMKLVNNAHGGQIVLERDFGTVVDDWRISAPVQLPSDYAERLAKGMWLTLGFDCTETDLNIFVSEIAFFPTIEEACEHYGDIKPEDVSEGQSAGGRYSTMLMSDTANVGIRVSDPNSDTEGYYSRDEQSGGIILHYTPHDKHNWGNYRFMPMFKKVPMTDAKYIRIVYKAENSKNQTEPVALRVVSNGAASVLTVEDDVKDTGGKWVLSPIQQLSSVIIDRWLPAKDNKHCTVSFFADQPDAKYMVREIIFFRTLEEAAAYKIGADTTSITIAGTPIEDYTIVIPENPKRRTQMAVDMLKSHIYTATGVQLEVITDAEPEREHEIIVGTANRKECDPYYNGKTGKYVTNELKRRDYFITVVDGDLLITGGTDISIEDGMTDLLTTHLGYKWQILPEKIELKDGFSAYGIATINETTIKWDDPAPVADPDVYTDDFNNEKAGESPDYWLEAYATDNWKVKADGENPVYGTEAKDFTYTRLHVYERDIDYTVKMRFDKLDSKSDAGVLARYNDVGAFIRVGYSNGQWYLRYSEGQEFNLYTLDTEAAELTAGTWYKIRLTVQKNEIKVYVDDKLIMESTYVTHLSPGPMGMFAENAAVSFDDVSVTLVSGQGKVMKGVVDSTFWTDEGGLCSGTVFEMADGTLRYVHSNEARHYVSTDGGLTWTNEKFTDFSTDCVNLFRLASGKLIKLMEEKVNGELYHVSYTSADEGKTWTRGGLVEKHDYKGYGTMIQTIENDKFTQVSSGRVFLSQNYQGDIPKGEPNAHMKVFNEMWYSDDEGATWIKCKQSSFDCTDITHFGESKVIETADGALLWLTPWNNAGFIIAAESKDNGETWSDFYNMTQFPCAISSFGIMRDPYADNNTTYYMAWVYNQSSSDAMPRSRLSIAKTTDGRNWQFLGDVYRWENSICGTGASGSTALLNHIVDPFLTVTEDYLFVGSGFAARRAYDNNGYHNNQQQKVYRIEKDALVPYDEFPNY